MTIIEYSKKVGSLKSRFATLAAVTVLGGAMLVSGVASADSTVAATSTGASSTAGTSDTTASTTTKNSTANTQAAKQAALQNIISKGDQEIERRLTSLSTLTNKVNDATKLTPDNKSTLSSEVSSTSSGLTSLKSQLDSQTTVAAAVADAKDIYTEYRVYALVAPKINLVKVADDQQVVQAKLTSLAQKLQTRITADQHASKNVTTLESEISDMNSNIRTAQAISSNIESSVINLQPSDYNSNHALLSGDDARLVTAHSDDKAALTDAKNIVSSLKNLK
jgi:predicted  nucleic acid-binding Zn-ribbon protein